jgi:hypothetical protein
LAKELEFKVDVQGTEGGLAKDVIATITPCEQDLACIKNEYGHVKRAWYQCNSPALRFVRAMRKYKKVMTFEQVNNICGTIQTDLCDDNGVVIQHRVGTALRGAIKLPDHANGGFALERRHNAIMEAIVIDPKAVDGWCRENVNALKIDQVYIDALHALQIELFGTVTPEPEPEPDREIDEARANVVNERERHAGYSVTLGICKTDSLRDLTLEVGISDGPELTYFPGDDFVHKTHLKSSPTRTMTFKQINDIVGIITPVACASTGYVCEHGLDNKIMCALSVPDGTFINGRSRLTINKFIDIAKVKDAGVLVQECWEKLYGVDRKLVFGSMSAFRTYAIAIAMAVAAAAVSAALLA